MFIKSICCLAGMVNKHTHTLEAFQSKYIKVQADYIKIVYNVVLLFFFLIPDTVTKKKKKKTIGDKKENFPVINSHNLNPYQL